MRLSLDNDKRNEYKSNNETCMRWKYELRWYEFNLTEMQSRKFLTEFGARTYKWYLEAYEGAIVKIYEL